MSPNDVDGMANSADPDQTLGAVWSGSALFAQAYRKFPKYSDTQSICCYHSKIWTMWLYHREMSPKDAEGMANSVDPDQTAPLADWSGSALFAQTCLSENLGSLRHMSENLGSLQ